jgi:hypothetical protein
MHDPGSLAKGDQDRKAKNGSGNIDNNRRYYTAPVCIELISERAQARPLRKPMTTPLLTASPKSPVLGIWTCCPSWTGDATAW